MSIHPGTPTVAPLPSPEKIMPMLPKSRPQRTRQECEVLLAAHGVPATGAAILFVRGYYKKSMGDPTKNDINIYDDAAFIVSPKTFQSFNANTDPAKSGRKLAMLKPQVIDYYRGKHKGKYDALRPYPEGVRLACTRDGLASTCANTNIHKGGATNTFSEGCLTIPPTQYEEWINLVYSLMSLYGQKIIKVCLVEE